jgi:hypothetical protein
MRMGSAAVVPSPLRESTTACGRKNYARFQQFFSVLGERSYGLVSDIGTPRTMTALHARALVRGRQCQTTNLPPRVIGALRENVWRSHTHFRTGNGGPSCYRWRKSGNGCRTSMRPATRPYFSRLRASDRPCSSNSRFSPTTRRNRPPLARFDPLDPQWPLLNLTVARFNCRHTEPRPAKARLIVGRSPPRSSIPRPSQLRPTHARKLKPRPCGAFFFGRLSWRHPRECFGALSNRPLWNFVLYIFTITVSGPAPGVGG